MKPTFIALLALCLCLAGCATVTDVSKHLWSTDTKAGQPTTKKVEPKKVPEAIPKKLISDPIVEMEIRKKLKKPVGQFTKADLEKVKELEFTSNHITDASLKEVAKLKQLTLLRLHFAQITDGGIIELTKLKQLKSLDLYATQISDKGLKEVAQMKQLEWLGLNLCEKVTNVGLKEVAKLQQLKFLCLPVNAKISDEGWEELRKALPNCEILSNAFR